MNAVETYYGPNGPDDKTVLFNASSFLGFLRRSNDIWRDGESKSGTAAFYRGHSKDRGEQRWVYRGHADSNWKLVPSAARPNSKLQPIIEKFLEDLLSHSHWSKQPKHKLDIWANVLAYFNAVNEFTRFGHKQGFFTEQGNPNLFVNGLPSLPRDRKGNLTLLHDSLSDPMALSGGWLPLPWHPETALAQHHGIPTFLLDWTENPWFAAHCASNSPINGIDATDICVWALDVKKMDDGALNAVGNTNDGSMLVTRPAKSDNLFLSSQKGLLTLLLNDGGYWEKTGNYLPVDEWINNFAATVKKPEDVDRYGDWPRKRLFSDGEPVLRKIILAKEHVRELRQLLLLEDITVAHLMPTLDNIAKTSLSRSIDLLFDP